MSISKLVALIPPPAEPVFPADAKQWKAIEKETSFSFPTDLFEIMKTYGSGHFFQGSLRIFNPVEPAYTRLLKKELSAARSFHEEFPEYHPYPAYPIANGLIPFAYDDNGQRYYWLTTGDPDQWPIVLHATSGGYWEKPVKLVLSDFLVRLVTHKLKIQYRKFWGNDFSEIDYNFLPKIVRKPRGKKGM
jgi:hypothetical protein